MGAERQGCQWSGQPLPVLAQTLGQAAQIQLNSSCSLSLELLPPGSPMDRLRLQEAISRPAAPPLRGPRRGRGTLTVPHSQRRGTDWDPTRSRRHKSPAAPQASPPAQGSPQAGLGPGPPTRLCCSRAGPPVLALRGEMLRLQPQPSHVKPRQQAWGKFYEVAHSPGTTEVPAPSRKGK